MRTSHGSIKLLMAFALCLAAPVQAKLWTARIAAVNTGAGSLTAVQVTIDWPEGASSGTLRLQAGALDFPALSYRTRNVDWRCPLLKSGERWTCAGSVRADGSPAHRLALEFAPDLIDAKLAIGASRIDYRSTADRPGLHAVRLEKVPVAWLKAFMAGLWEEGRWTAGRLGGRIDVSTPDKGPFRVDADLGLDDIGMETPDGLLAAAAMAGRLRVKYEEVGKLTRVDSRFTVRAGELLFDSLYVKFPASPVQVQVLAEKSGAAPWRLPTVRWSDPGVLEASGSASLDAQSSVVDLDLQLGLRDLGVARDRYLSGFLAPAGFPDLLLNGQLDASLQLRAGAVSAFAARPAAVNAVDAKGRFTFAGIDGDLRWTRASPAVSSSIAWNSGALFGIGLGPARFDFSSSDGELLLGKAVAVPALGGRLVLEQLRWQAPSGEAGARFQFGLGMEALDLGSLSQRLGWPPFTGSIAGRIPSARYQDDVLELDGGLQMQLFGGNISLQRLSMERPFGVAPTLSADIRLQDIDLEPMTRVFGFGAISGRLDGRIEDLRLVDWAPVAFDARLQTDSAWKGKRRISQGAVNDISSIGGSGLVGSVQTQALKFFDDFGYDQIGLGCKLKDNVCVMDGLGSAGNGYIIVAGAGIPRIQVVGFRRRVDWPTLVSRLKAATQGTAAPVIQ